MELVYCTKYTVKSSKGLRKLCNMAHLDRSVLPSTLNEMAKPIAYAYTTKTL